MTKKLTILDIAKLAGVGKSTVSRVLTNDPKVKQSTRIKVEQVIRDSGFVPSKSAQAMRGGSAKVVGVILSRLDSPSENKAVSGILDVIYAAGYDAVIMESQFCVQKTNEHLDVLKKRNVDGVIIFGFTGFDVQAIEAWQHKAVVIAVDTDAVSSVGYDNVGVIELAMAKLQQQGKRNISFVGVDPSDKTTGLMRLNAYINYCNAAQLTPMYCHGQLSHESAYQLTDSILTKDTDAIVCASDTLALGVAKRLQECNRSDVMVSGVGTNELLSFIFPNTFSIDPGYFDAGKSSANLLIKQLSGQHVITHLTQEAHI
ncbi:trehalose operon repressor TreR [Photobacterium sanguinicancri]|uniref:Autoinducer 2-binding periplasmic protein LuxP n=1 Tax=Photobacterium sanguinicancri TaxID=875932 RepID=A0ABX4G2U7_9GAMM|nr:trehalose operon repressor TreR [Photobacterium sanguinicancri]MDO6498485.1 trehalose operon repressor TreR [Photobacterium sanguinicancri]OZS45165.1 trehalose operon repressor [Photobacterium sanguinicancri]